MGNNHSRDHLFARELLSKDLIGDGDLGSKDIQASSFFERQQSDRKKRTFEILSRFNPALANEVVYKDKCNCFKDGKGSIGTQLSGSQAQKVRHEETCPLFMRTQDRACLMI